MNTANTELSGVEWILLWAETGPCNKHSLLDEPLQRFVIGKLQVPAFLARLMALLFAIRKGKQSWYLMCHERS
jgi:hypothetical protein